VDEAFALTRDRLFDGGVGVAEAGDADATEEVEVVVAVFVAQMDAMTAYEEDGVALVGVKEQLLLCCLDRFQFRCCVHATMTSVPSLTRVETRSGSRDAASAGRMRTRLTP